MPPATTLRQWSGGRHSRCPRPCRRPGNPSVASPTRPLLPAAPGLSTPQRARRPGAPRPEREHGLHGAAAGWCRLASPSPRSNIPPLPSTLLRLPATSSLQTNPRCIGGSIAQLGALFACAHERWGGHGARDQTPQPAPPLRPPANRTAHPCSLLPRAPFADASNTANPPPVIQKQNAIDEHIKAVAK